MAETEYHFDDLFMVVQTIRHHFADEANIAVLGNMLLFYEEGNKRKHVSPDVFVVFEVPKRRQKKKRLNYLVWEEGKAPQVVIELTSKSTRREDMVTKRDIYRGILKVEEYFLFDPTEDYLKPSMQGFRRSRGAYKPIELDAGRLLSRRLNAWLERHGDELRLRDAKTNELWPTPEEYQRQRAEQADQRADSLAAEVERLRQQLREK